MRLIHLCFVKVTYDRVLSRLCLWTTLVISDENHVRIVILLYCSVHAVSVWYLANLLYFTLFGIVHAFQQKESISMLHQHPYVWLWTWLHSKHRHPTFVWTSFTLQHCLPFYLLMEGRGQFIYKLLKLYKFNFDNHSFFTPEVCMLN